MNLKVSNYEPWPRNFGQSRDLISDLSDTPMMTRHWQINILDSRTPTIKEFGLCTRCAGMKNPNKGSTNPLAFWNFWRKKSIKWNFQESFHKITMEAIFWFFSSPLLYGNTMSRRMHVGIKLCGYWLSLENQNIKFAFVFKIWYWKTFYLFW